MEVVFNVECHVVDGYPAIAVDVLKVLNGA
jgi:hypothetical protein